MSTIKGNIYRLGATKEIKEGFKKREGILHVEEWNQNKGELYSNYIPFEVINDRCELFDNLQVDDRVELTYQLRGNLWKAETAPKNAPKKAILSLQAYKVEKLSTTEKANA